MRDRFTWLAYFTVGYYAYLQASLGPLMPFLRRELGLSYTFGALHLSAFALGMICGGTVGDRLTYRFGRRLTFWCGAAGLGAGAVCLTLGTHAALTIASTLLMGWTGSLLSVTVNSSLSDRHGERRATAVVEANVAGSLSAGLAPLAVGSFQRAGFGWRPALFLGLAVFLLIALRFQREPLPQLHSPSAEPGVSTRRLPPAFWAYWAVILLGVSTEWCIVFWGADFMEQVVRLKRATAAATMSVFFVAMVTGRLIGSRLTRASQGRRLLPYAVAVTMLGFLIFWQAPVAWLNVTGLFLAGLGAANLFPLTVSTAISVAPHQSSTASARIVIGSGTAMLLAPLALGWAADRLGIGHAYALVALLLVAVLAVILLANRLAP